GGGCYHMIELFPRPDHVGLWHAAVNGTEPDWDKMLEGFVATVDWPAAAVWPELHGAFPDAVVLLSTRDNADAWWRSFSETILQVMERGPTAETADWHAMAEDMLERLTPSYRDRTAATAAYEAHNQFVRDAVAPDRLIEWKPGDGWAPICAGLRLPEPNQPFPHVNTTDEFRAMAGLTDTHGARP
ncbi:MAG TPA: sulfotransferase, partial [Acidimicrobiales bacterium]|nr:sulfotransferase [Acidimicrobiales bacterium]